ncbi:hypothetical protein LSM04_001704 [Trypanosoma melophagium]|uniref:uncharacterized protein n=1 Tax=Trypanosoma melophagium TaxID=715481 RepID=UPI00351A0BD9|nr:hypothetical protein LSM04_001704 [Trypanosoma melophagium]
MLQNTGAFLRQRYNTDVNVVAEPFFPSEKYDVDVSSTHWTNVYHTLQIAEAFLRGLFPDTTFYYPAVHTIPEQMDTLLRSENLCSPVVDALFKRKELLAIAADAHYDGYCSSKKNRCKCARKLGDIAASYQADGRLNNFPLLKANLEKWRSVTAHYYLLKHGYNTSDEVHLRMGSQGQSLAQELLSNARAVMTGTSSFKLYHKVDTRPHSVHWLPHSVITPLLQ